MNQPRMKMGAVVLDGMLYVMGGRDKLGGPEARLRSVERFDPIISNRWMAVAPMSCVRSSFQAAVLGGKIYVAGGVSASNGASNVESSVECYDPSTNLWENVAPLRTQRYACGLAAVNGKLYIAGGSYSDGRLERAESSVDCYDPSSNRWYAVAPMDTRRMFHAVAELQGKLYAIGGGTGEAALGVPFNEMLWLQMPHCA